MSAHNSGDTSRKPSGSSTHSGVRSGTSSPIPPQSQRKLTPTTASNMLGVGMSSSGSMKGLNAGWQVWGASNSSKRNASVSSANSISDLAPSQSEGGYRTGMNESWAAPRTSNATWEETSISPQRKDFSHLNLQHARPRQTNATPATFSGNSTGDRSVGSKGGQFAQYDGGLSKEPNSQRYAAPGSPAHPFVSVPFTAAVNIPNAAGSGYGSLQQPLNANDSDLSMAFRGMAVEDDFQSRQQGSSSQPLSTSPGNAQARVPSQFRPPYGSYLHPVADYGVYYGNQALPRESYVEYPMGYDIYRNLDPSVFIPSVGGNSSPVLYPSQNVHRADRRQQPGAVFYDFPGPHHPTSQFYYPPPAVVYPSASPLSPPVNPLLASKKRDQYNTHQHLPPQNMMFNALRSSPSPIPQTFGAVMDYGSQVPIVTPGGPMYMPQTMQYYAPGQLRIIRPGEDPQAVLGLRSARLEDFRADRSRKWELRDIFGYVVEFSGDQHGSRFIQQKLESATSEEKQRVFDEIMPGHIIGLVSDVFGNYVIQKLLEHGTAAQRTILLNAMEGHMLTLSLHMYGCRVVQRAIEYITPEQQTSVLREIEPHVLRCVKDANGNHVIQKIIERVSPERLGFVDVFCGAVFELSTHAYGCRVLQRCLEHLPHSLTQPIIEELHKYIINLMQDQFGNYVIQFVLEHGQPHDRALVTNKLHGQLLTMSRHKFASNVVEKALVCADSDSRRVLIDEILTVNSDGSSPVVTMMKDQYGNYVLQRAMNVAEGEQRDELFDAIRPQVLSMRRASNAYNKHLLSIERLLEKYTVSVPVSEPAHATSS